MADIPSDSNAHASSPRRRAALMIVANVVVVAISLLIIIIPAEFVFRHRYGHMIYNPRQEVRAVQQYLTLDPQIGFKWLPNISPSSGVQFKINDIESPPLSTDEFGVMNPQAAIEERASGRAVDVVGIGDSFMEMAARTFHEHFKEHGLSYYSLAIHRQCPQQYDLILDSWAAAMKPRAIIYGIFENDFNETTDFLSWERSKYDWFTYHSGTWCGPPIGLSPVGRFMRTYGRGWYTFGRVLDAKLRGENMTVAGPSAAEIDAVAECIRKAFEHAQALHARFVLVVIPSKPTATTHDTRESRGYDEVLKKLKALPITVVDLRPLFRKQPDPATLYYVKDGHWNDNGIALAATAILNVLEGKPDES